MVDGYCSEKCRKYSNPCSKCPGLARLMNDLRYDRIENRIRNEWKSHQPGESPNYWEGDNGNLEDSVA